MTPQHLTQLADDLLSQVELANFDGAFPDLTDTAQEAADYLSLVAPFVPMLLPLLGGEVRRKVERREIDRLRDQLGKCVDLLAQLVYSEKADLQACLRADLFLTELLRTGGVTNGARA